MIQLDESPAMVTVGASLFADALTAQVATRVRCSGSACTGQRG